MAFEEFVLLEEFVALDCNPREGFDEADEKDDEVSHRRRKRGIKNLKPSII